MLIGYQPTPRNYLNNRDLQRVATELLPVADGWDTLPCPVPYNGSVGCHLGGQKRRGCDHQEAIHANKSWFPLIQKSAWTQEHTGGRTPPKRPTGKGLKIARKFWEPMAA